MDFEDSTDMKDIFQKLIKNPTKLMGLVKTVGDKLDSKIKSGDLKESEIIKEATEMMSKMKNMPGMDNIQSMLSKMGMGDLGNLAGMAGLAGMGGKLNTGAMEANLNKKMKMAQTKERIRAKAEANAKAKLAQQFLSQQQNSTPTQPTISDEELAKIFSTGEKVERTPRNSKPTQNNNNNNNNSNKKKKGKK
jgi:spore coat protein CotH